jgi:transmembrane sensor
VKQASVTERKTTQEIDAEAAEWAARVDRAPLTRDEEEEFSRWTDADPRRLGAFGRVRAIWLATEKAKALGSDFEALVPTVGREPGTSRRRVVGIGLAVAASIGVVSVAGLELLSRRARYATGKGETRVVALGDSSVITLNTQSEMAVGFTQQERRVRLLRGEALFDVAKNPARPFIVESGDTLIRVVGTSFTVRHLPSASVQVLVREGVVEVSMPGSSPAQAVRAVANTRTLTIQAQSVIAATAVDPSEVQRELAWQNGRLAFEGQSLSEAVAEFARYSDTRIIIADPSLGKEEIAGLFRATDPVGFAQTVAVSLRARVEIGENEVRLTR